MSPNKRQLPKHRVIEVERTGVYPNVWWEHHLACGHTEKRKRKAPAKQIACTTCGRAKGLVIFDESAAESAYEQKVQAQFAQRYGLAPDEVLVMTYEEWGVFKVASVTLSFYKDL